MSRALEEQNLVTIDLRLFFLGRGGRDNLLRLF